MFKLLGGILRYVGLSSYRIAGVLPAENDDEVVNLAQLKYFIGIGITEIFHGQTSTTTLSKIPKNNSNIFVYTNSGSGYTISDPNNDYTLESNVIVWSNELEGLSVMVKYTY